MPRLLLALAVLLALLAAPSALASGRSVIDDCTEDEVMSKTYTQKEYRDALAQLPADADQYGNCRDIIARAQEGAATNGGAKKDSSTGGGGTSAGAATNGTGGGTGGTGAPASTAPAADQLAAATAEDRAAADAAARDASTPALGAGPAVNTNAIGTAPDDSGVADLPAPVLVLLALLLAGALALAAIRIRSLVLARGA